MNPNLTTFAMADQIERTRRGGRRHHHIVRTDSRLSLRAGLALALHPLSVLAGMIATRPIGKRPEVTIRMTNSANVGRVPN